MIMNASIGEGRINLMFLVNKNLLQNFSLSKINVPEAKMFSSQTSKGVLIKIFTEYVYSYATGAASDRYRIHSKLAGTLAIIAAFVQCFLFFIPSAMNKPSPSLNCTLSSDRTSCDESTSLFPSNVIINGTLPPQCVLYCCDISLSNFSFQLDNYSAHNMRSTDQDVQWNCSAFDQEILNLNENSACSKYELLLEENNALCQNESFIQDPLHHHSCRVNQLSTTFTSSCIQIYRDLTMKNTTQKFGNTFWVYFGVFCLVSSLMYPIVPLINAIAYAMLGNQRNSWGKQRVWGKTFF